MGKIHDFDGRSLIGDWNMTGLFSHSVGNGIIIPILTNSYFSDGLNNQIINGDGPWENQRKTIGKP